VKLYALEKMDFNPKNLTIVIWIEIKKRKLIQILSTKLQVI
jgi:hypothetical protein